MFHGRICFHSELIPAPSPGQNKLVPVWNWGKFTKKHYSSILRMVTNSPMDLEHVRSLNTVLAREWQAWKLTFCQGWETGHDFWCPLWAHPTTYQSSSVEGHPYCLILMAFNTAPSYQVRMLQTFHHKDVLALSVSVDPPPPRTRGALWETKALQLPNMPVLLYCIMLSSFVPVNQSIDLSVCLSIYLSKLSVCLSIYLSMYPSVHPAIHPPV